MTSSKKKVAKKTLRVLVEDGLISDIEFPKDLPLEVEVIDFDVEEFGGDKDEICHDKNCPYRKMNTHYAHTIWSESARDGMARNRVLPEKKVRQV